MKAMLLANTAPVETLPLQLVDLPEPEPASREVRVRVSVCGVCHTELDEIEGRLACRLPIVPGHQIVGSVDAIGPQVTNHHPGERIGIAWINSACGRCPACSDNSENLCLEFKGTGCDVNGGYAEYTVVPENYAYELPSCFTDAQAAPLLCAGAVGYRALRISGARAGGTLGLFGFGSSAHIIIQLARHMGIKVLVFSRSPEHQALAMELGAVWAGEDNPPSRLNAAIDFTPVGETVPRALSLIERGGRLAIAVIRKRNPVPPLDYEKLLWYEKEIKSVANVTRRDVIDFLALAAEIPVTAEVHEFGLVEANEVLRRLKQGGISGSAVLKVSKGDNYEGK